MVVAAIDTPLALICAAVLFATAGSEPFTVPPTVVTDQLFSVTPVFENPGVSVNVYVPGTPPVFCTLITYVAVYCVPLTFAMTGLPLVTVTFDGFDTGTSGVEGSQTWLGSAAVQFGSPPPPKLALLLPPFEPIAAEATLIGTVIV